MAVTTNALPGMMMPGATPPAKSRPAAKPSRYKSPYDPAKGGRVLGAHQYVASKKKGKR